MTTNLDELRKVAEAATPGPWTRDGVGVLGAREDWDLGKGPARIMAAQMPWRRERMEANAEHVATFDPPTVLALLSRLEQAEQAVQRVRDACESDSYDMHKDYGNGELVVPVDSITNALDGDQS